jgi:ribosomal protein L32
MDPIEKEKKVRAMIKEEVNAALDEKLSKWAVPSGYVKCPKCGELIKEGFECPYCGEEKEKEDDDDLI